MHNLMFGEPARAIFRNVIVIAVGFTPLLFAPLRPYITVGFFLAAILFVSGTGTLILLPALVKSARKLLFPETRVCKVTCQCGTCILSGVTFVVLVALNAYQFLALEANRVSWVTVAILPFVALACWGLSKRSSCAPDPDKKPSCDE